MHVGNRTRPREIIVTNFLG